MAPQFTLYSFVGSQWAGVAHLAIAEKGISKNDYIVKEVDLVSAENFEPEYLNINPHGTVPSLVSSSLEKALVQSADILRYVDNLGKPTLVPTDPEMRKRSQEIIDLVHSHDADTNTILFTARDDEEMKAKKASMWNGFLQSRQDKLEKEHAAAADNAFYRFKRAENASVQILYATDIGKDHEHFYERSHQSYKAFANSLNKFEELLVGPHAAGDSVTEADFHVVPWLSHALWGAGTEPSEIQNFEVLEALVRKSEPGFSVGPKTKAWWKKISETQSFKEVFPHLH